MTDDALKGARILIVDDEPVNVSLAERLLQAAGYANLKATTDSRQVPALCREFQPDLLLLDLMMPYQDGFEVMKQLGPRTNGNYLPILILTADIVSDTKRRAFDAGAMDYITKPLDRVDLLARVRSALQLKNEMDRRKGREAELLEVNQKLERAMTALDEEHRLLREEQERSDRLLVNILPKPVAELLKRDHAVIAERFAEASILFADLADFTRMSADLAPEALVALLNEVFSAFDRLAEKHRLEKIKTIGDAYMVVGGVPTPDAGSLEAIVDMAMDMQDAVGLCAATTGKDLRLRIGIHTGPVVAGVVGTKKFLYDLWGDAVNIASRMESHGLPGRVQVTQEVYGRLRARYVFEKRGRVTVKGKGVMATYLLIGKKTLR